MPVPQPSPVLDLPFLPDEYLCTWHVPGLDEVTVHLPGMVELRPSRMPYGRIYGELPLVSMTSNAQSRMSFPQVHEFPVLRATLANGAEMLVLDARVTFWHEHGSVRGAAAAVRKRGPAMPIRRPGPPEADPNESVTFTQMRFQVGALDAILGVTPIGEKTSPQKQVESKTWTWEVKTDPATPMRWTGASDELKGVYAAKVNTFDFYDVSIRFAPALDATTRPSTLFELVKSYVEPVRAIASIATGKSQPITYLMLARTSEPTHFEVPRDRNDNGEPAEAELLRLMPAWQIFGTGLQQAPYQSDAKTVRDQGSVLLCHPDDVDLLSMIHTWWDLALEHHPLIETYAGMLHAQEEHPRSRFLLLIQSLEGMHGHETKGDYEMKKAAHHERRAETLERIREHVQPTDFQFIKKRLQRDPFRSLETALAWAFDVPFLEPSIQGRLAETHLVQLVQSHEAEANRTCSTLSAIRIARNGLAHGTRGFDAEDLDAVNEILDRVVRAHSLRLLGCPQQVLRRLFD